MQLKQFDPLAVHRLTGNRPTTRSLAVHRLTNLRHVLIGTTAAYVHPTTTTTTTNHNKLKLPQIGCEFTSKRAPRSGVEQGKNLQIYDEEEGEIYGARSLS